MKDQRIQTQKDGIIVAAKVARNLANRGSGNSVKSGCRGEVRSVGVSFGEFLGLRGGCCWGGEGVRKCGDGFQGKGDCGSGRRVKIDEVQSVALSRQSSARVVPIDTQASQGKSQVLLHQQVESCQRLRHVGNWYLQRGNCDEKDGESHLSRRERDTVFEKMAK